MSKFVHLHNHTAYSLLDGALRIEDMVKKAKENNMPAVAMTDHGVLYGMIEFYRHAKSENIKPILGCELYLTTGSRFEKSRERYHLIVLTENNIGYHNLIQLVSKAWLEGFYYKPRVDKELLAEYSDGLICLSACIQGEISQLILKGRYKAAKNAAAEYRQIFGRDNFFLELQDHNLQSEKEAASGIIKISQELDLPLVITNDAHYLNKSDADLQDVLLALQTGTTIDDKNRMTFEGKEFYFKTPEEMEALFPDIKTAYENTVKIAERCNVELDFDKFYLPDYPDIENGENPESFLKKLCCQGLKNKVFQDIKKAEKRLEYELSIIYKMGYASYFLIVYDFVKYAEENGIRVGPGRGSAAGSLVAYLLNITKVNPLKYGLLFERFLNPERATMPDIDIDFDEQRDEIIEYVKKRYGEQRVAQIGTFGTMAARAAVRDVGRALGISYGRVDKIAKLIPTQPGTTIKEALSSVKELQDYYKNDPEIKKLIDYARGVEGMPRHISTHAAGIIIGAQPLTEIIPLQKQDDSIITQLPMGDLEALGLLKMDFLGLRNLTVIENTLNLIKQRHGKEIDIDSIPLDDKKVYRLLQSGNTAGVFQMESYLFQSLNRRLKPDRFSDLIALLALGRPGPLGSDMVDDYIKSRHGEKEPEYLHPKLKPILEETFGMILYQEQVMEIASTLGGYTMGEADLLRRGMGKKKLELIAGERKRFINGAVENGIDKKTANKIFDQMEYFAGYGFNKSHSTAYAFLAYQTAYLKVHYPADFMSALLSSVMGNQDKISDYIKACREINIEVLPPDINISGFYFTPEAEDKIRFGLKAVKNVGSGSIEAVIEARKEKKFESFTDFLQRIDMSRINIQVLEAFIKSGVFSQFSAKRSQLLLNYKDLYKKYNMLYKERAQGQISFFDMFSKSNDFMEEDLAYQDIQELRKDVLLEQEKEFLGIYVSGHPLDKYKNKINEIVDLSISQIENIKENREIFFAGQIINNRSHITKRGNKMAFLTLEDWSGKIDVIVFPDLLSELDFDMEKSGQIFVVGRRDDKKVIASKIIPMERKILIIDLNNIERKKIFTLKKFLFKKEGNIPVILKVLDNKLILSNSKFWFNDDQTSQKNLSKIIDVSKYKYI
ncbi:MULTISPECIES: DNA polymerase III subunit alpha [unclassified Halanaerobium]|uniref:DNA polymerase III subunit alpha n=1 Tax=unclassified Halanaerobium TaxID=2641197 RepID=UPI000DF2543B|nr:MULTISPECIES: DNA polymerase III subunit alpha [unclassified Halanaerobium]RCW49199.1 DNA polymerase-3 subunit alpha [Halanaerobium sp. MA284_MarDTE_T2]RCW82970.1 DNA polymerase-3 subunit alpha [Halanaerobium sp. DL-01]